VQSQIAVGSSRDVGLSSLVETRDSPSLSMLGW